MPTMTYYDAIIAAAREAGTLDDLLATPVYSGAVEIAVQAVSVLMRMACEQCARRFPEHWVTGIAACGASLAIQTFESVET